MAVQYFTAPTREDALRQAVAAAAAQGVDYPLFEDVFNPAGTPKCWRLVDQGEHGEEYRAPGYAKIQLKTGQLVHRTTFHAEDGVLHRVSSAVRAPQAGYTAWLDLGVG